MRIGDSAEPRRDLLRKGPRPERIMALGFLVVILAGTLLLSLPAAAVGHRSIGLLNAMFTATSSVCVTGLVVVDTGTTFSLLGQIVIMLLIQVGGLGFMIFATLAMVALGRRISLRSRVLIRESMNANNLTGLVRLSMWFSGLAILIELLGACVLSVRFVPMFGWKRGLLYSVFHSVSAFCNAGFDLFGGFRSLEGFQRDPLVLLTLAVMIVLGGLGFSVLSECLSRKEHQLSLHAKLVLLVSGVLLALGMALTLALEWGNPGTLGALPVGDKFVNAFFQSATLRTAGFASLNQGLLTDSSKLISILFMFVGASPASTGGGVKTTTLSVMILLVVSVVRGRTDVTLFGKQLPQGTIRRAFVIIFIGLVIVVTCACALSLSERDSGIPMIDLMYEAASAFGTAGLSSAGTPGLNRLSHILLMPIMFFGRVGPLTMAFALASRMENNPRNRIHFPEEKIMIG